MGTTHRNFSIESVCVVGGNRGKLHSMIQVGSNADSDILHIFCTLRAHILQRFKLEQNQEDEVWGLVNILRDVLLQKRY